MHETAKPLEDSTDPSVPTALESISGHLHQVVAAIDNVAYEAREVSKCLDSEEGLDDLGPDAGDVEFVELVGQVVLGDDPVLDVELVELQLQLVHTRKFKPGALNVLQIPFVNLVPSVLCPEDECELQQNLVDLEIPQFQPPALHQHFILHNPVAEHRRNVLDFLRKVYLAHRHNALLHKPRHLAPSVALGCLVQLLRCMQSGSLQVCTRLETTRVENSVKVSRHEVVVPYHEKRVHLSLI